MSHNGVCHVGAIAHRRPPDGSQRCIWRASKHTYCNSRTLRSIASAADAAARGTLAADSPEKYSPAERSAAPYLFSSTFHAPFAVNMVWPGSSTEQEVRNVLPPCLPPAFFQAPSRVDYPPRALESQQLSWLPQRRATARQSRGSGAYRTVPTASGQQGNAGGSGSSFGAPRSTPPTINFGALFKGISGIGLGIGAGGGSYVSAPASPEQLCRFRAPWPCILCSMLHSCFCCQALLPSLLARSGISQCHDCRKAPMPCLILSMCAPAAPQLGLAARAHAERTLPAAPRKAVARNGKKRILIMMSLTGGGHKASAEALKAAFVELYGPNKYEIDIVDMWSEHTPAPVNQMPKVRRRCVALQHSCRLPCCSSRASPMPSFHLCVAYWKSCSDVCAVQV